ncbi:serine hydrolase domain-containing protein [uncultured Croceitalea sp.]|uniref:serine hydrolase domain-containing protein n=1 Tax=uncultured Croceitalea sp. TaxID=1798908 RepID=UPI0033063BF4
MLFRKTHTLLILSCFFLLSCGKRKKEISRTLSVGVFKKEISSLKEYFQIPGMAVLVKKDDEIIYEDYLGYSNVETKTKLDSTSLFPIASLTKVFSGISTMALVEQGKLALNTPANYYFESAPFEPTVQLEHLLSHTSQGVPPGEQFYYSSRFGALTKVIETAAETSFENVLNQQIIQPLRLKHTFLLKDSVTINSRKEVFAKPYLVKDTIQNGFVDFGYSSSAGVVSTARDLLKIDNALDANVLISEASKNQMFTPYKDDLPYGYGIFSETFLGKRLIWAYGQYDCYSSLWLKVPSDNITIILLANNNLMSDPARLIYGNATSSLFVISALKNLVFDSTDIPLFSNNQTAYNGSSDLHRENLRAQALAASFMARFDSKEMDHSIQLLRLLFSKYPNYLEYANLALLHNLLFLKEVAFHMEMEELIEFDQQIVEIGEHLLQKHPENPYANYYLASFYEKKERVDKTAFYYQRIVEAKNFSNFWYTSEAKQWLASQKNN